MVVISRGCNKKPVYNTKEEKINVHVKHISKETIWLTHPPVFHYEIRHLEYWCLPHYNNNNNNNNDDDDDNNNIIII